MRKNGLTHREITSQLGISLGTADLWTAGIVLSQAQKEAIRERRHYRTLTSAERKINSQRLKKFQYKTQYTDLDLLKKIHNFYAIHNRIPLKREFNALKIYRDRFGSWNNAIKRAGFEPNEVLFSKKHTAKDGHSCDSFSEKIIDDWLFNRGIVHRRSVRYKGSKFTADFFVEPDIIIEFFGLAGVKKKYDANVKEKRLLCKQLNLQLVELYPEDIFGKNNKLN